MVIFRPIDLGRPELRRPRGVLAVATCIWCLSGIAAVTPGIALGQSTSVRSCTPVAFTGRVGPARPSRCQRRARPTSGSPRGRRGHAGVRGPAGFVGLPGPEGLQGLPGATGPAGLTGMASATGLTGQEGAIGVTGSTGPTGNEGAAGPAGPIGLAGLIGLTGARGATGFAGLPGLPGAAGSAGPTGLPGVAGSEGQAGPKGETGAAGIPGPAGPQGEKGVAGPAGLKGETGLAGSAGPKGETGAEGPSGSVGLPGATGVAGPAGPEGSSGSQAYAEFYALMPPDNAATVAAGAPVFFPQNGPTAGGIVRLDSGEFVLPRAGTYGVDFSVSVTGAGTARDRTRFRERDGRIALYGLWTSDRYQSDCRRCTHYDDRRELNGRASQSGGKHSGTHDHTARRRHASRRCFHRDPAAQLTRAIAAISDGGILLRFEFPACRTAGPHSCTRGQS